MDGLIVNLLLSIISLLSFAICLFHKTKFSRYVGLLSIIICIHTSVNVIINIFHVNWYYALFVYVCIFILISLICLSVKTKHTPNKGKR